MQRLLSGVFFIICASGCGGNWAPVSGKVTLDGKPLSGAFVTFQPIGESTPNPGPGSMGKTNSNGEYSLKTITDDREGAVIGKHRVMISKLDKDPKEIQDDKTPTRDLIPAKFNRLTSLEFKVPREGTTKANFDLKTR